MHAHVRLSSRARWHRMRGAVITSVAGRVGFGTRAVLRWVHRIATVSALLRPLARSMERTPSPSSPRAAVNRHTPQDGFVDSRRRIKPQQSTNTITFDTLDRNGDGVIDRQEWEAQWGPQDGAGRPLSSSRTVAGAAAPLTDVIAPPSRIATSAGTLPMGLSGQLSPNSGGLENHQPSGAATHVDTDECTQAPCLPH